MARKKQFSKQTKSNIALITALLMMALLFYSSSKPYTEQSAVPFLQSLLKGEPFKDFIQSFSFQYAGKTISVNAIGYAPFIEFFIRKAAHFLSFFILGYAWLYSLSIKMKDKKVAVLISLLLCIGYACIDEGHQYLTPQRTALLEDVILDSVGSITAMVTYFISQKLLKK